MHGVAPNALFLTLWGEGQRDGRGIPINAPECTFRHYRWKHAQKTLPAGKSGATLVAQTAASLSFSFFLYLRENKKDKSEIGSAASHLG